MTNYDAVLGGGAILRLAVVERHPQNVAANQSIDDWSLTLYKGSTPSYDLSGIGWSVTINDQTYGGLFTFDFRATTSQLIAADSTVVTHLPDGTKQIPVTGGISDTGTTIGGGSTGGTFYQTRIPRGGKVRVAGVWVPARPRVRVAGAWVDARVRVRVAGAWVDAI